MKRPRLPRPTLNPVRRLRDSVGHTITDLRATVRAARAWEAGQRTLLDAIAPEWVEHSPDAYVLGAEGQETHTRSLVVRDWPPHVAAGWLAPLLFDCGGDVAVAFHQQRFTKAQALRFLQGQRVVQTSLAQAEAEGARISRPATGLALASAADLAVLVEEDKECLFSVALSLTLRAPSRAELDALEGRVRQRLSGALRLGSTRWQHATGFRQAGTVYGGERLGRRQTVDTTSLAMAQPFLTADVGTAGGPLLGVHLADRSPLRLDLWDRAAGWHNPGLCMAAVTGGGKTVTLGHLIAEHLTAEDPPDVVLIDAMKGDYRRLVRELGGQTVRVSTRPTVTINPFDLPPSTVLSGTGEPTEQNPVTEQTRLVTGLVALMVTDAAPDGTPGRMTKAERAVTEAAILQGYAGKGIDSEDAATWDAGQAGVPTLPDVLLELRAMPDSPTAASLAERLAPFCTGTLAGLFSRPTTLRLDAPLTSFDLEGLDSELRPLAVWLIGDLVWKVAKRDRRRRVFSMDEVAALLRYPESARLVAEAYTLGRAYNLSVWSATQLLSDYTSTPEGERALQSADTVLLLRQAPGKGSQDAAARYGLSEGDRAHLEAAGAGVGILRTPKGTARVRVTPSPMELALLGGAPVSEPEPESAEPAAVWADAVG